MAARSMSRGCSPRGRTSCSRRFRLQQSDLDEHAGEIINAGLPNDLTIAELVDKHRRGFEAFAGGIEPHESADVGPFERQQLHDVVAIDDDAFRPVPEIGKRIEPLATRTIDGIGAVQGAGSGAVDDTIAGVVSRQRIGVHVVERLLTPLEQRYHFLTGQRRFNSHAASHCTQYTYGLVSRTYPEQGASPCRSSNARPV